MTTVERVEYEVQMTDEHLKFFTGLFWCIGLAILFVWGPIAVALYLAR